MNDMGRDWVTEELLDIRAAGTYRYLRRLESSPDSYVTVDGKRVMLLCSNDYLGLATEPSVIAAAAAATRRFGTGAGSSRLVSGNNTLYDELEKKLAAFERRDSALVFSSGYAANLALMTTMVGSDDVIFSDELNHASIVDGCRLSRARTIIFRHNDVDDLAERVRSAAPYRRGLLVVEGVYSLDGDIAPLEGLVALAREHGLMVVVDEAHATGVLGAQGRGACARAGVSADVDVVMGTMGKALGSAGAFVACRSELRELLINRARSFIYTTGLPPAALAAASAALDIARDHYARREHLLELAMSLRDDLGSIGYVTPFGDSQIVPVIIGDNELAVLLSRELFRRGVFVQAIRPPSVPHGTARLRVTPMATHSENDIERAIDIFGDAGDALGIL